MVEAREMSLLGPQPQSSPSGGVKRNAVKTRELRNAAEIGAALVRHVDVRLALISDLIEGRTESLLVAMAGALERLVATTRW